MVDNPATEQPGRSGQTDCQPAKEVPQWRSTVAKGVYKQPDTTYKVGEKVLLKKGRSTEGPYTVSRVNSDGTYDLKDSSGNVKRGVRESLID
ncbi:hypothetical protein LTR65_006058 [Meristemomyces frigidus]